MNHWVSFTGAVCDAHKKTGSSSLCRTAKQLDNLEGETPQFYIADNTANNGSI